MHRPPYPPDGETGWDFNRSPRHPGGAGVGREHERWGFRRIDRRSVVFSASALPLSLAWLTEAAQRGARARGRGAMIGQAAVVQYLVSDVAGYCTGRFRREQDRREMVGAAAELAYLAGWKCHDIGDEGLAQAYYGRALQLATESDPVAHAAWTLRILAHQSLDLGQPHHCQGLATRACDMVRGRTEPAGEALFAITGARAHTANGQRRRAVQAIARADQACASWSTALDHMPGGSSTRHRITTLA
jgi:hypothetical protein